MDIALAGATLPQQHQRAELAATPVKPLAPKDAELNRADIAQPVDAGQANAKAQEEKQQAEAEKEQLAAVAEEMSSMMSMMRKGLEFRVDESSGQPVVSVLDIASGDVIRQIPSEEALKIAQKLSEVTGLLMKTEA
ncbi:flagellar protein FlaG [Shewanella sp. FJAT-52076]|uniref:flagellar protein FlaG n=1 Tax=Shewanella sp. FJAT-52076 TaxID=2864202 RepID=UPI001C6620B9|nr:flagellar protein FlaG [Shewanella sp. FJAT-52076]QYJ74098.1 flagellar protein FlaG [Shewanella sp. FJAT-52076]